MYIELHAASAFSFLQGASLPETLIERAADLGYPAIALLDADGVYGAPRFHKAAQRAGLRAIIGAELTIEKASGLRPLREGPNPRAPRGNCPFLSKAPRATGICAASLPA
jgi:error-prone DNA polymerase